MSGDIWLTEFLSFPGRSFYPSQLEFVRRTNVGPRRRLPCSNPYLPLRRHCSCPRPRRLPLFLSLAPPPPPLPLRPPLRPPVRPKKPISCPSAPPRRRCPMASG